MKLFEINETKWVAANSLEEAIDHLGLDDSEIESTNEIPESEWDEEIEVYFHEDSPDFSFEPIMKTIRSMMEPAIATGQPTTIMTEE